MSAFPTIRAMISDTVSTPSACDRGLAAMWHVSQSSLQAFRSGHSRRAGAPQGAAPSFLQGWQRAAWRPSGRCDAIAHGPAAPHPAAYAGFVSCSGNRINQDCKPRRTIEISHLLFAWTQRGRQRPIVFRASHPALLGLTTLLGHPGRPDGYLAFWWLPTSVLAR